MRSVLVALCIALSVCAGFAQSDRGTLTGTISDPAGAVVPGAAIEVKNMETAAVYSAVSTETGNYTLAQLPTGVYQVTVSAVGFKAFVRQGITVHVAQTLRIDAGLEVGALTESVTVNGDATMLKTETADVSHNVNVQSLNELPILGVGAAAAGSSGIRNPNNVLNLVPGAYYIPNNSVKINGAPNNSQSYRVEGMDATNQGFPYAAAQTQPSVDAIQEVAVQTSNFAPEYGIAGGGFFSVTMRSGTNQLHGSAYDYMVNEALNAGMPFTYGATKPNELTRPAARRHDYGFTLGGPVAIPKLFNGHDKTFFFFNFEQFRETQIVNNILITVPTQAYRNGDFSGAIAAAGNKVIGTDPLGRTVYQNQIYDPLTCRPAPDGRTVCDPFQYQGVLNRIDPARFDPVALKIQSLIPQPDPGTGPYNNLLPVYPNPRHTTIPALKIDQSIGSRGKLSFYWSFTNTDAPQSPTYGQSEGLPAPITAGRGSIIHAHVERLNYDHTLSPTLLLHLGAGYQVNKFFDDAPVLDYDAEKQLGLKGGTVKRNFPSFNGFCPPAPPGTVGIGLLACPAAGGMYNMGPGAGQQHDFFQKPSGNASITWVKSSHTYKAGLDLFFSPTLIYPYSNTAGNFSMSANQTSQPYLVSAPSPSGTAGFPYASFLLGLVDSYGIAAPAAYRVSKKQVGVYVQDSWKMTRKLTFTYGLRWDYGTYYREEHNRGANFSPITANPKVGGVPGGFLFEGDGPGHCNCDFAKNYPYAFGPRLGVAYQINPKTVLRAGWGLMYSQTGTTAGGLNIAVIAPTANRSAPGPGLPAMILKDGIPFTPQWPVFDPGVYPNSVAGNQTLPPSNIGSLPANVGYLDPQAGRPARQNQWSFGIQHEITQNLVVEASYVGNRGVWWQAPSLSNINAITPQILSNYHLDLASDADRKLLTSRLDSAAAVARGFKVPYAGFAASNTVAQSIRPYPQFGTIAAIGNPSGKTWYDSLQAKVTKRLSHGLNLSSTFTWQKSLQLGVDRGTGTWVNNVVANKLAGKSISSMDQPVLFTVAASYQVPRWAPGRIPSAVLQDWQIGTLLTYSSGLPIPVPAATTQLSNQIFQPTLMNRVAGQPFYNVDLNCRCYDPSTAFVLNKDAWVNPADGQFGNSSEFYGDYRYQRHPQENLNFGRIFRIREGMSLNIRVEFNNILNRTYLNNPTATNPLGAQTKTAAGLTTGGFGYVNRNISGTQFGQPRNGVIVARFMF